MASEDFGPSGVTFFIDPDGVVRKVLHDSVGIFSDGDPVDQPLSAFINESDRKKCENLIRKVHEREVIYNWELHVKIRGKRELLIFSGIKRNQEALLIGTGTPVDTEKYLDELMRINNEHVNDLRTMMKERSDLHRDSAYMNELSRLNNELSNTQRQLLKKTSELERSNELKNRMFGMAAHDLRSPLSVILSFSELLLDENEMKPFLNEENLVMVREMKNSSEHMIEIIEDMLDISAIESGSVQLQTESIDLNTFIFHLVKLNRITSDKKEIQIRTELADKSVSREIDTRKFTQVMNNLLTNAIKYSNPGTTITAGTEIREGEKWPVRIFVRDEGVGIPEKELKNLFKPFSKTSVEPTGGEKSTGLGLAISKRITEAHHGRIRAERNSGSGMTFWVELP
ncbi:MAG: HAMP domain-containing sensor histidine kinase [Balneolaceae bacterium]